MRTTIALQFGLLLMGCDRTPFFVSPEESATRACEERLKSTLTSPSSYTRRWSSFTPAGRVTKDEEIEKWEADRLRAAQLGDDASAFSAAFIVNCLKNPGKHPSEECGQIADEKLWPETAFVLIEYEASNAFNARLRGYFDCRMTLREDGKYSQTNIFSATALSLTHGDQLKSIEKGS